MSSELPNVKRYYLTVMKCVFVANAVNRYHYEFIVLYLVFCSVWRVRSIVIFCTIMLVIMTWFPSDVEVLGG